MPYTDTPLGRTWYESRGRKSSPGVPLICLHGGPGGSSRRMQPLLNLARSKTTQRRVFIYDQLGGGRSSASPKSRWTTKTFVRELNTLAKLWELDEFHLFGASWGTTLALEFALAHPKKVRSLVFQSPMFSAADWQADADRLIAKLPAKTRKVIRYCHEIGATDAQVYQDAMYEYYARHVCRNKTRLQAMFSDSNPNGAKVYQHMWGPSEFKATGTLREYDQTHRLTELSQPALVICGEHDEAQPATGRRYTKQLTNAAFTEIKGASHAILAEKPKQLLRAIDAFIAQHD